MDAIKEAMIREEDTGEINPALDPYRDRPETMTKSPCWECPEYHDLQRELEAETRRAEDAHAMTLRQSLEIERLNRLRHGVCAYPNCTCTPTGYCTFASRLMNWMRAWRNRGTARLPFWPWFKWTVTRR